MKEQAVQTSIIKAFKKLGGDALKVDWSKPGYPDLVAFLDGKIYLIEVKRKGGRLSPMQKFVHEYLKGLGIEVIVAYSVDDISLLFPGIFTNKEIE